MGTKMGRPTDNPKTEYLRIRITKDQKELLSKLSEVLNISKTDVVILGLKKVEEELNKK